MNDRIRVRVKHSGSATTGNQYVTGATNGLTILNKTVLLGGLTQHDTVVAQETTGQTLTLGPFFNNRIIADYGGSIELKSPNALESTADKKQAFQIYGQTSPENAAVPYGIIQLTTWKGNEGSNGSPDYPNGAASLILQGNPVDGGTFNVFTQSTNGSSSNSLLMDSLGLRLDLNNTAPGTNASGDTYYRKANGYLGTRHIGTEGQVYVVQSGLPVWKTVSISSGSSNTVNGTIITARATGPTSTQYVAISAATSFSYFLSAAPKVWQQITIADIKGNCNSRNITVQGNGKLVNGFAFGILDVDYGVMQLTYNGINWSVGGLNV